MRGIVFLIWNTFFFAERWSVSAALRTGRMLFFKLYVNFFNVTDTQIYLPVPNVGNLFVRYIFSDLQSPVYICKVCINFDAADKDIADYLKYCEQAVYIA